MVQLTIKATTPLCSNHQWIRLKCKRALNMRGYAAGIFLGPSAALKSSGLTGCLPDISRRLRQNRDGKTSDGHKRIGSVVLDCLATGRGTGTSSVDD